MRLAAARRTPVWAMRGRRAMRCVDEEVKRILRDHSKRFLERQHAQEEDTELN